MPDHVPIEAVRALCLGTVLATAAVLLLWRPLVRHLGWSPGPTLALVAWTVLVLAMTLPMTAGPGAYTRFEECVADPAAEIAWSVRIFGSRGVEDVMNVVLWVPCGFLAVLATRRPFTAPALVAASFVVVEFLQNLDPGRECDPGDWAYNSLGVAVGAMAGALLRYARLLVTDRSIR